MTSLEEHCADFIIRYCRGPEYADYRKRCMEFWRKEYGEMTAKKIESLVKSRWNKKGE